MTTRARRRPHHTPGPTRRTGTGPPADIFTPRRRGLTAASRQIPAAGRVSPARFRNEHRTEQQVWDLIHVPEANYAVRFMGNALSRVRLFPAVMIDPDEDPLPVDKAVDDPEVRLPPALAEAALAETERMSVGAGGQSQLMSRFGTLLTAVGNTYVVVHEPSPGEGEVWEVLCRSNLVASPGAEGFAVKRSENGQPDPLSPDALIYRIWQSSPQWPDDPDSGMYSVLSALEELEIHDRQFRAIGRSRSPAGMLVFPSELDPPTAKRSLPDGTADPSDQAPDGWSEFELDLLRSFITPTENDGSAASVMPHLIRGPGEILQYIRHIGVDRPVDPETIARMNFLIRRVAHGVNLPVEVLLGLADTNHWTAWMIGDDTYRAHVEPTAQIPAAGLAQEHLRPALLAAGHPAEWANRITFGKDPSQLVVRPNRSADAQAAHDRVVISDAAYRDALGFPDTDAPDDDELARRLAQRRGPLTADMMAQLLDRTGVVTDPPLDADTDGRQVESEPPQLGPGDPERSDAPAPQDGGDPTPDTGPDDVPGEPAVVAAAVELPMLGERLAAIEARLRDRLQVAASSSLQQALRTAGNRLRGQVQQDPELKAEVNGRPAEEVGVILGEDRAPTTDTDVLLAGAFGDLRASWDEWTGQAQNEMASVVAARMGVTVAEVEEQIAAETDTDRGWEALYLALFALAGQRVFHQPRMPRGEADGSVQVPATIVRDALAVAGGADTLAAPAGTAAQAGPPGLLTGERWLAALALFGVFAHRWTWQTGFPSQPFKPHQDLDGATFEAWDDPRLENTGAFPPVPFFFPGDHAGCQCSAVPSLVRVPLEDPQLQEVTS